MFRYYYIKNLPEVFTNYFVANNKIQHHNTRNASKLHKPNYKRTNSAKHTLSNKGVNIWNGLDFNIKNIKSYNIYKRETKNISPKFNTIRH